MADTVTVDPGSEKRCYTSERDSDDAWNKPADSI